MDIDKILEGHDLYVRDTGCSCCGSSFEIECDCGKWTGSQYEFMAHIKQVIKDATAD